MNTWIEVYTRCMDGEFFRSAYCPRDGHSNATSIQVEQLVATMRLNDTAPSLEALVAHGFDGDLAAEHGRDLGVPHLVDRGAAQLAHRLVHHLEPVHVALGEVAARGVHRHPAAPDQQIVEDELLVRRFRSTKPCSTKLSSTPPVKFS